jgi:hypothetical protein
MKQFFATLLLLCFLHVKTSAQQHFIKTDVLGYLYPLSEFNVPHFKPKISLSYERLSDSTNQSLGIQLNYGSIPVAVSDNFYIFDTSIVMNSTYGLSLHPEYRNYLGTNKRKVRLFGNIGAMLYAGKAIQGTFLLKNDELLHEESSYVSALGINLGGGVKYCFTRHLYTELLVDYGFPIYRSHDIVGLEDMFYRFELGIGYYFKSHK